MGPKAIVALVIFLALLSSNIIGTVEARKNRAPVLTNNSPLDGATEVYTNPRLSINVHDPEGRLVSIWFSTNASGTWENIGVFSLVAGGTYSVIPTSMTAFGTRYFWKVRATDGEKSTERTFSFTTTHTTSEILQLKWTATGLSRTRSGVLIANVLGDAREEVIHAGVGKITVLDGSNGSPIWSVSDSTIGEFCQPQIADLNLDMIPEIVVPLEKPAGLLVLRGNTGSTYWRRADLGLETYGSPVIHDVNADGYPEVFFASTDISHGLNGTGRITALSYDGRILYQTFVWRPCAGGLSLGDTDWDGEFELYVGDRNTEYGNGTISFWARNLTQRWNRKDIMESSNIPVLADVTKDGILDVVAGDLNGGVAVLRSSDGSKIRMTLGIPNDAPVHYQFSVYDIDKDGNLEMMMADGSHNTTSQDVIVWDLVRWEVDARMYVGNCFYGPQVGDVTGDGIMEMLAASSTGIFVFDKSYSLICKVTNLTGSLNYAVIQDIDNDGYSELVISSSGGVVYAFDTPARKPNLRPRSEVQFYSEYRRGAAEYVPPPGVQMPIGPNPNPPSHDVAVTNLVAAKTVIGRGCVGKVIVVAQNQGDFAENFNVTIYANTTRIATLNFVLASRIVQAKTFAWNTTGFAYGNYTLKAVAEVVSEETDMADNNYTSSIPVHVGIPGDVSGTTEGAYDGTCNMRDMGYLILKLNTWPSSPNWNPNTDVNDDAVVDMRDIAIAIINLNQHEWPLIYPQS